MSQPPGLFDIGKLAMAVSWASGPVKAGGRAVEVQMSTGTKGGNAVESFFVASFSRSERGRVLNKGQRMPQRIEGRTSSRLLLTISLGSPNGEFGKNRHKSKFGNLCG